FFFFSSRRRHTRSKRDWSSDVCSSDLGLKKKRVRGGTLLDCGLRPVRKVVLPAQLEGELKLARVVGSRRLACAAGGTRQGIAKLVDGGNVGAVEQVERICDDVDLEALAQGDATGE